LQVLYLIFNEGYTATSGPDLQRGELTAEAIRLTRELRRLLPADGEVSGLLALMLLTESRRAARTRPDGSLVPLAEQDRGRWNQQFIQEGVALISEALSLTALGPYQLQAAIAAIHAEADRADDTDWPQILACTTSSNVSRRIRWSRSTAPSRSQWCKVRRQDSNCSERSKTTNASQSTTASTPSADICSN
jgi:predicted RNA polymerase sigma factor